MRPSLVTNVWTSMAGLVSRAPAWSSLSTRMPNSLTSLYCSSVKASPIFCGRFLHRDAQAFRELMALDYALDCIREDASLAATFRHKHLVYEGDSQVMEACINKMGGNQRNFPVVKHIWETAFELDLGLEMQWHPREESNQRLADSLEKQLDPGDWVVSKH